MADYLEALWERADVLLEQMRRMERGLSGLTGGSSQENAETQGKNKNVSQEKGEVYDIEKQVNYIDDIVYKPEDREKAPAEQASTIVNRKKEGGDGPGLVQRPEEDRETGAEQRKDAPLAARLERLERAVSVSSSGPWSRGKERKWRAETSALTRPGAADVQAPKDPEADWPGSRPASDGAPDWVEQADRAFRRDSRRYDGSFYLY